MGAGEWFLSLPILSRIAVLLLVFGGWAVSIMLLVGWKSARRRREIQLADLQVERDRLVQELDSRERARQDSL